MNPRIFVLLCVAGLAVGWAPEASAQLRPGDWLVSDIGQVHNGILYFDPNQVAPAALTTLVFGGTAGCCNWVCMHRDNHHLMVLVSGAAQFAKVSVPTGVLTPIVAIPDSPNGIALDQDGTALVSTSAGDRLYRVDLTQKSTTVLAATPSVLNNVAVDRDTGEIVVAIFDLLSVPQGKVLRLAPDGTVLGTLAAGLGATSSVAWDPVTGDFFVTTFDTPEIRRIDRTGKVTFVTTFRGANALKVDPEDGTLLVCGLDRTARLDRKGQVVGGQDHTHVLPKGTFNWTAVEIYGSRKLSGSGPATPGTRYDLHLSFPGSPGVDYAVLASLTGFRPGIPLPDNTHRVISLFPDTLFFLLLQLGQLPGVCDHFRGKLDASGQPAGPLPSITIPRAFPPGLRICLAAVAFNPALASGLDISNPWALIVR